MKRALHILLLVLTALTATAQRYPITITPVVTPPYTLNLGEMTSAGSTMLTATVTVNDITAANLPVRLHIKLTSPGITIESMPTATVSPMMLNGGESRILTGADLAPYLRLNNLSFNGYSKERYQQTGQIPGGVWKLTIEARHFYTNRLLSNSGGFTFWASVYDPPVLVSPANGVEAPSNPSLPMVLSWQASKHTGGTAPVQYTVNVWEMLAVGVPAPTVAMSSNPIYTATTTAQSHTLVTTGVPLKPSVRYCWQVTVSDPSRQAIINKGGKSEVREFTYMSTCPDVDEIRANVKGTQVDFTWDPTPRHDHFEVELLKEGGSSDVLTSYDDHFSYYDFERGTTWKARIKGYCPGGLSSDYSAWTSFSVPQAIQPPTDDECPDCGCEDVGSRTITNFEPGELQAGDTIKNRTGRTRFIVVSATPNGDGTYNGNFLLWMELWKVKFLCEYTNLKVNTDGVIVAGHWASVNNPALLGDPAQVAQFVSDLKNNVADYNNTIRDTISLTGGGYQTIYINSDGRYIAVKDDGTEVDVSGQLDEAHRTLVTDDEGHQMVVTADGTLMSAEQYRATGNNKTLISNSNTAKDRQAATGKVTFSKADGQKYGFDAYDATSNAYDAVYPALEGGYRPAYKSIARWQTDNVLATPLQGYTFRNQLGVPYAVKNGAVELRGDATAGESPVYAHVATSDTTTEVVGKLNLVTFEPKEINICLVPVNDVSLPGIQKLEKELNDIFRPAVASVRLSTAPSVKIQYADGRNFVHGGSGPLSVYSADEKSAIKALGTQQSDTYYLFMAKDVVKLDPDGNRTIVAGYMPVGRQFGFIFEQFDVASTIAHEVSHGAFSLHHTFSDESESYHAPQGTTPNLMDYSGGTALNHLQWQWMHESHTNLLGFLDDEEEGEGMVEKYYYVTINGQKYETYYQSELKKIANEYDVDNNKSEAETKSITVYYGGSEQQKFDIEIASFNAKDKSANVTWTNFDSKQSDTQTVTIEDAQKLKVEFTYSTQKYVGDKTYTINVPFTINFEPIAYSIELDGNNINKDAINVAGVSELPMKINAYRYSAKQNKYDLNSTAGIFVEDDHLIREVKCAETAIIPKENTYSVALTSTKNKLEIVPILGSSTTFDINKVTLPRLKIDNPASDGSSRYCIDDYNDYKQYDGVAHEDKYTKEKIQNTDYYIPNLYYTSESNQLKIDLYNADDVKDIDYFRFYIGGKCIKQGDKFTIADIEDNAKTIDGKQYLQITDDSGTEVCAKIELRKLDVKKIESRNVVFVRLKYDGMQNESINTTQLVENLNNSYNQIGYKWEQKGDIIDIEIKPSELTTINKIPVAEVKRLLSLEVVPGSDTEKYKSVCAYLYNNVLTSKLSPITSSDKNKSTSESPKYYVIMLHNSLEGINGFANVPSERCFISKNCTSERTLPHELGHCQGLSHMAKDTSSDAQQKSTNLMGYGNGLNIFNWQIETLK